MAKHSWESSGSGARKLRHLPMPTTTVRSYPSRLYELTRMSHRSLRVSHMPILAHELIDTVVDFLHGDRPSLCACALAGKSCLASARYHLFSDIELNAQNFISFLSLIESTSHIAPLVRGLVVRGQAKTLGSRRQATPADVFLSQNISIVATSLRNVVRLKLSALDWDLFTLEAVLHSLTHAFEAQIRRLDLHLFKFRSFSEATNFICHFSNLRHLHLNLASWDSYSDPCTVRGLRTLEPLRVHMGEFTRGQSTPVLTWLLLQCPSPKLISATFRVTEFDAHHVIQDVLPSAIGDSLQILHISLFRYISEEIFGGSWTISIP